MDFDGEKVPLLRSVVSSRAPSRESVVRRCVAALTSYMAIEKIADYKEAICSLDDAMYNLISADADFGAPPFDQVIAEKVALRNRQYNLALNSADSVPDDEHEDDAGDGADAYRRASRGG